MFSFFISKELNSIINTMVLSCISFVLASCCVYSSVRLSPCLYEYHQLSVCVSIFLSVCKSFSNFQLPRSIWLSVSLSVCQSASFLYLLSISLFSSKTCHLVVDRAGERKLTWLSIGCLKSYPVTCLLMNLGLFLYLAICGRDSNLDRFGED